jgi:hypothetical protein
MTKPTDDLEAVRAIVEAVESFETDDKERIIRWALEKLKLSIAKPASPQVIAPSDYLTANKLPVAATDPSSQTRKDLRTFVAEKQPKSDVQFAATVAFYHRFEGPTDQRKDNISADDLKEACRLVNRERLNKPLQTLNNARTLGLLDSAGRGVFAINSVGENLVAMTLPTGPGKTPKARPKKSKASGRVNRKAAGRRK